MKNLFKEKKDIQKSTKEFEKKSYEKMILLNQLKLTKSTYNNSILNTPGQNLISRTSKNSSNRFNSKSDPRCTPFSVDFSKRSVNRNLFSQPQILINEDESFIPKPYIISVYRKKGKKVTNFGAAIFGNE